MTKEQAMEAYIKETRRVNQNFIYIFMFNTIYNRCLSHPQARSYHFDLSCSLRLVSLVFIPLLLG